MRSLTAANVSAPRFEQNIGQFSGSTGGFAVRTPGYALYLQDGAIRFIASEPVVSGYRETAARKVIGMSRLQVVLPFSI